MIVYWLTHGTRWKGDGLAGTGYGIAITVEPGYKSTGYKSHFVNSRAQYYALTWE